MKKLSTKQAIKQITGFDTERSSGRGMSWMYLVDKNGDYVHYKEILGVLNDFHKCCKNNHYLLKRNIGNGAVCFDHFFMLHDVNNTTIQFGLLVKDDRIMCLDSTDGVIVLNVSTMDHEKIHSYNETLGEYKKVG